ncbi:MAG: MBL fold metallo-hydrolase [Anaerolineaceae bacterium]|nr:MBL fold metallo-hydrolase [Anaerolineaceae bacterium]
MTGSSLELKKLIVGLWQENCYLILNRNLNEAMLVDPGDEAEQIKAWIGGLPVSQILLTHAHADHLGAVNELRAYYRVHVGLNPADRELAAERQVALDFELNDGDIFWPGPDEIVISHTPGHTAGSVCLHFNDRALVGDVIFPGGPGHTHNPQELSQSILSLQTKVFKWSDQTELFPGHGLSTTVGQERPGFTAFLDRPRPPELFGDVSWTISA